jgi:hypothetical protein
MLRRPLPKARARRKARRLHSYFVASTLPIGPAGPMHVLDRVSRATQAKIMLLAFEQSQLDLNGLDVINATRLIGQQDDYHRRSVQRHRHLGSRKEGWGDAPRS